MGVGGQLGWEEGVAPLRKVGGRRRADGGMGEGVSELHDPPLGIRRPAG